MALYGVLGDIHGNREALQSALDRLQDCGVERLVCVGDLVGYNADPDECVLLLRLRNAICIAGNHDLIGTGQLGFDKCSNKAMHSLKRTRRALLPDTAQYLKTLPAHVLLEDRFLLTHGGVRDVQQYMTQPKHVLENIEYLRQDFPGVRICFFGHTHEQKVFEVAGTAVSDRDVNDPISPVSLNGDCEYFINPGSVDASRKRESKFAECAVFDSENLTMQFHRVAYDDATTEEKAEAQGYRMDAWRDRLYDIQRRLAPPRSYTRM
jgi:predicted phosphodiesterase